MDQQAIKELRDNLTLLSDSDQAFAQSLLKQLDKKGSLSPKQNDWLERMAARAREAKEGVPDFTQAIEVGDFHGVIQLFETARKHLKHPKIRLSIPMGTHSQPLALTVAGSKSKHAGCVNVTDGRSYHDNTWFGRVTPDGVWEPSKIVQPELMLSLVALLTRLAKNPAHVAAEYGRLVGYCCFCHSELTDSRSKDVGYGPTCAKNWGLPWGEAAQQKEVA